MESLFSFPVVCCSLVIVRNDSQRLERNLCVRLVAPDSFYHQN